MENETTDKWQLELKYILFQRQCFDSALWGLSSLIPDTESEPQQ